MFLVEENGSLWSNWLSIIKNLSEILNEDLVSSMVESVFICADARVREYAIKTMISVGSTISFQNAVWNQCENIFSKLDIDR